MCGPCTRGWCCEKKFRQAFSTVMHTPIQHFLECRNRLIAFGRNAETELGLHGAGLSFASIIGSIVLLCAMFFDVLMFTSRRLTSAPALSSAFNHVKLTIKHQELP